MLTVDGLLTGYPASFGYGSWTLSTADSMVVEFELTNSVANFQVSRYNAVVNSVSQSSVTFTMLTGLTNS